MFFTSIRMCVKLSSPKLNDLGRRSMVYNGQPANHLLGSAPQEEVEKKQRNMHHKLHSGRALNNFIFHATEILEAHKL